MSRTDKTRPYWVKVNEVGRAYHDHADGVCDLDAEPTRLAGGRGVCGLSYDGHSREINGCSASCWMCRAPEKQEKHRQRARAKRAVRNWWRDYAGDPDVVPPIYDPFNEEDPW